jgi:hypothetical protein
MDVSELRKKILRALDDARQDAAARRQATDEAARAYEKFLADVGVPVMRQAATVLKGEGHAFAVETPADSVRITAAGSPDTFLELTFDASGPQPEVIGRVSVTRGRRGLIITERPIAAAKPIGSLTEDDVSAFLISEVPKLVLKA